MSQTKDGTARRKLGNMTLGGKTPEAQDRLLRRQCLLCGVALVRRAGEIDDWFYARRTCSKECRDAHKAKGLWYSAALPKARAEKTTVRSSVRFDYSQWGKRK